MNEVDEKAVGIQLSNSDSQQVADALAALVGVRAWLSIWLEGLPIFEVKSDSVAALTMVARMHTRSPQVAVVAKELALTFSESCVRTRQESPTSLPIFSAGDFSLVCILLCLRL